MNYTGKGLVCFDMDMTLLDHRDWKIPDSARKAVELLRENYYIAIATGRDMDAKYSEGLSEQVQPDGIIHLNGTKVTVDGEMIYEHRMSRDLVERILKFSQGQDFAVGISVGAEDYFMNPEYVTRHDIIRWGQSNRCFRDDGLYWGRARCKADGGSISRAEAADVFQPERSGRGGKVGFQGRGNEAAVQLFWGASFLHGGIWGQHE